MNRGACQTTVNGVARVGHDLVTKPPLPWRAYMWFQRHSSPNVNFDVFICVTGISVLILNLILICDLHLSPLVFNNKIILWIHNLTIYIYGFKMNLDVKEITDVKSGVYYKEYHWPGTKLSPYSDY